MPKSGKGGGKNQGKGGKPEQRSGNSHGPSPKDLARLQEFRRLQELAKQHSSTPSSEPTTPTESQQTIYQLTIHPSAANMPKDALALYRSMNSAIVDVNRQYGTFHEEHLRLSKQNMLETAEVALAQTSEEQPKNALLLGVGNCLDIPLRDLAEKFDSVTLVELDRESVERAVQQLPEDLQRKIHIIVADITGIAASYTRRMTEAGKTANILRFLPDAARIANDTVISIPASTPDFGNDYTFIASQLLMTQLSNLPQQFTVNLVQDKYHQRLSSQPYAPNPVSPYGPQVRVSDYHLFMAHQQFGRRLADAHIDLLARSVIPSGTVYFADTLARIIYKGVPGEEPTVLPMVILKEFEERLYSRFNQVREVEGWVWNHTPNYVGKGGQDFLVQPYILKPKTSSTGRRDVS